MIPARGPQTVKTKQSKQGIRISNQSLESKLAIRTTDDQGQEAIGSQGKQASKARKQCKQQGSLFTCAAGNVLAFLL